MAIEAAIICVVAGAVLGLRYNVLVLVPAVMFAVLLAVIVGIARADSFWSIALMTMALSVAVQVGYLAGIAICGAIEAICATVKSRNPELSSLRATWPQTWQPHSWQLNSRAALGAIARLRQPPPPQV